MRERMKRPLSVAAICCLIVSGCGGPSTPTGVSTPTAPAATTATSGASRAPTSAQATAKATLGPATSTAPATPATSTASTTSVASATSSPAAGGIRDCDYRPGNAVVSITDADLVVQPQPQPTLPPPTAVDPQTTDAQLQVLDALSTAVQDNYVDPNLRGLDWTALVETYRARIQSGLTDDDADVVLNALIGELGDNHSYVDSPTDVANEEAEQAGQASYVGIGALFAPVPQSHSAVVVMTLPGSPAEDAGLLPHDSVVAIDGQPVPDDAKQAIARFRGTPGSQVELTIDRPNQGQLTVDIVRAAVSGSLPEPACVVPGTGVGYIMLPNLLDTTMPDRVFAAVSAMASQSGLRGLVIDNRLDTGGLGSVLTAILGLFVNGKVGTFAAHGGQRDVTVDEHDINGSQSLPLVVLVGQETVSFGEVMSGVLQGFDGAKVVGTTTQGNVEILSQYELPNGWRTWLAHEVFVPAQASYGPWEDTGIIPDVHVPTRWDLFTEANDPALAAAVDSLH